MRRGLAFHAGMTLVGAVVLVWLLFPLYHIVVVSLKSWDELFEPTIWPLDATLQNYVTVVRQEHFFVRQFWRQLSNSARVAGLTTALVLVVSSLASFAISRLRFAGSRWVSGMALFTYIIPASFLAIPFYRIMAGYGLLNTHTALVAAMVTFTAPYALWVLSEYARAIPRELDEAAAIDGAGPAGLFARIYVPLLLPALAAIGTYAFIFAWNEYLYAFLLLSDERTVTLPVAMSFFLATDDSPWNLLMALCILYSIPPVVLYYLFRRYLVEGLFTGSVTQ